MAQERTGGIDGSRTGGSNLDGTHLADTFQRRLVSHDPSEDGRERPSYLLRRETRDERRMDGAERIKKPHAHNGSQTGKASCKTLTVDLLYFRLQSTTPCIGTGLSLSRTSALVDIKSSFIASFQCHPRTSTSSSYHRVRKASFNESTAAFRRICKVLTYKNRHKMSATKPSTDSLDNTRRAAAPPLSLFLSVLTFSFSPWPV